MRSVSFFVLPGGAWRSFGPVEHTLGSTPLAHGFGVSYAAFLLGGRVLGARDDVVFLRWRLGRGERPADAGSRGVRRAEHQHAARDADDAADSRAAHGGERS